MDGSGYPSGLSNGDILMGARILRVADVVEAMAKSVMIQEWWMPV